MTKDEHAYRRWLKSLVPRYKKLLLIDKYNISFTRNDVDRNYLSCQFNYPYLDAIIYYSGRSLADWKRDRQEHERRVAHEFCHIVSDPFYAKACDRYLDKQTLEEARERLTDHIAMIALRL